MSVITFDKIPELLKEAKNPLILTGAKSSDVTIELAMKISYSINAHIAATGNSLADLKVKQFSRCSKEWLAEIVNFMLLPEWKGFEDKGKPDLIIFVGYLSSVLNRFLSALKIFSQCKTLTLDNKYISNATYSLAPGSSSDWEKNLKGVIDHL